MKQWKPIEWNDECPECGEDVEVLTDSYTENMAYDGDEARCTECHTKGTVTCADIDEAYIIWDEPEDD